MPSSIREEWVMVYAFDTYELDTRRYELRCAGEAVPLEPLAFKVLTYLVQHRDHAVSKDELIEHLWPDQFMKDWVLVQSVVKARRAIGDNGHEQRYIKTVTGYGYRFMASVEEYDAVCHEAPERSHTPLRSEAYSTTLLRTPAPRQEEGELLLQELPLVGRMQELAMLHRLLGQAAESQGEAVLLVIRLRVPHAALAQRGIQWVNAVSDALQSYAAEPMC
jgi:DNA-binding winged helix-turn-helix (wHTH) protein